MERNGNISALFWHAMMSFVVLYVNCGSYSVRYMYMYKAQCEIQFVKTVKDQTLNRFLCLVVY